MLRRTRGPLLSSNLLTDENEELSMPAKMHAAVVEQFGKPLEVVEWDVPTSGAGQILVKTEACGH